MWQRNPVFRKNLINWVKHIVRLQTWLCEGAGGGRIKILSLTNKADTNFYLLNVLKIRHLFLQCLRSNLNYLKGNLTE